MPEVDNFQDKFFMIKNQCVKTFSQSPELSPPYAQTLIGTKEDGNYRKYKKRADSLRKIGKGLDSHS